MYSNNLVTTARQAPSRASTMPAIPTSNSKATARDDGTRRRVHSAVPSSRTTNMNIDDLLTISATNVNTSKCKVLLHKRLLNQRSQHHDQRSQHHMDEDTEHKQEDESVQNSESMATVTENDIKVRVVLGHQSQSKQQTELPTLPENNKQESKHSTNKQSVMKKSCSKLSPLTGAHCKLPIGTLNGNSFYLTCKNKSS